MIQLRWINITFKTIQKVWVKLSFTRLNDNGLHWVNGQLTVHKIYIHIRQMYMEKCCGNSLYTCYSKQVLNAKRKVSLLYVSYSELRNAWAFRTGQNRTGDTGLGKQGNKQCCSGKVFEKKVVLRVKGNIFKRKWGCFCDGCMILSFLCGKQMCGQWRPVQRQVTTVTWHPTHWPNTLTDWARVELTADCLICRYSLNLHRNSSDPRSSIISTTGQTGAN